MIKAIKKIFKWLLIGLLVFGVVWAICTFIYTFRVSYRMTKEYSDWETRGLSYSSMVGLNQRIFSSSVVFDSLSSMACSFHLTQQQFMK